jgi:hypothetical protein
LVSRHLFSLGQLPVSVIILWTSSKGYPDDVTPILQLRTWRLRNTETGQGIVAHSCNPATQEVEIRKIIAGGQPG